MKTIDDIFTYKNGHVINKELGKLISYGYDLHERDLKRYSSIPTFKFLYLGSFIPYGKKTANGGIYGWRIYRDDSSDMLLTQIGVFKEENGKLISYFLQTDNQDYDTCSSKTKLIDNGRHFTYDNTNSYSQNVTSEEFIEAIVMLGFNREDVIAVAEGKLTAKEAFNKIAPDDIKNIEWLDIGRRRYVFNGNVAISGNFGGISIDKFPFPFTGQPIFDCSKVSTWYIKFGDNNRRAKLINVNASKDSIRNTDLRTAIIDEPIDLSSVDATDTIFGHQVVLYPEYSIAPLNRINLALAIDSEGKKYVTDSNGHIKNEWFPETEDVSIERKTRPLKIFANTDNETTARMAIENGAEGIGLVRTETIFSNCDINDLKSFLSYYGWGDTDYALEVLKRLAENQIEKILQITAGKKVVIRLLDLKLSDFLRLSPVSLEELDITELPDTRGTKGLDREILATQLEVLMSLASKYNIELNILVPMINSIADFKYIKEEIKRQAAKYNISSLKVGAMIENLHTMNYADEFAKHADFISIGTNDLTESITGLSRNSHVIEFQILSEQVQNALKEIIYKIRAVRPEIKIGICGEHSNYLENISFLSNLDIDYISCAPQYVKANQELLDNSKEPKKVLQKTPKMPQA